MNNTQIIGRINKEPQLRTSTQGNPCLHFTLRAYRQPAADGQPVRYDLIPCVAWGEQAKAIAAKIKENSVLGVSGVLKSRINDRHDGSPYNGTMN